MKKYLILYHANCYDGFGAAYSAWKKLGESADYQAVSYGKPIPENAQNYEQVYIVDFSYPKDVLLNLAEKTKVTVLDHHKTAEEDLRELKHPNLEIMFDMTKSGALITWDYFCRKPNIGCPALIQYISDRDLWTFKLDGTKEVHAGLTMKKMDFEVWDHLNIPDLISDGRVALQLIEEQVNKICQKAFIKEIGGYKVPVVNTATSWSEVGHKVREFYPDAKFGACFTEFENETMWSLRSEGDFDVSIIAKMYGGGGHKNAAGFKVKKDNNLPLEVK